MRKIVFIFGAISIALFPIGVALKLLHLPGSAVVLLTSAGVFSLIFIPIAAVYYYKKGK
mgnify:CR=1 FL=1